MIVALLEEPRSRPSVKAIGVTVATPGTLRSEGAVSAGMPICWPDPACEFSTIRSPANERVTAWSIVAFVPSARIATSVTSARPTVSAAAVTIVRPGWRIEFSRASTPVMPRHATSAPITCASHLTTR